jgi:hypothetical protein
MTAAADLRSVPSASHRRRSPVSSCWFRIWPGVIIEAVEASATQVRIVATSAADSRSVPAAATGRGRGTVDTPGSWLIWRSAGVGSKPATGPPLALSRANLPARTFAEQVDLFTKNVLEAALNEEMTEHVGHEKHQLSMDARGPAPSCHQNSGGDTGSFFKRRRHVAATSGCARHAAPANSRWSR